MMLQTMRLHNIGTAVCGSGIHKHHLVKQGEVVLQKSLQIPFFIPIDPAKGKPSPRNAVPHLTFRHSTPPRLLAMGYQALKA